MRISYGLVLQTISFSLLKIRGIIPGDIFIFSTKQTTWNPLIDYKGIFQLLKAVLQCKYTLEYIGCERQ